jgi:hypothetical protein
MEQCNTEISEGDWLKIQNELGGQLHRHDYAKAEVKDWHFLHWMRDYGNSFFAFFRKERETNPLRLWQWWKANHTTDSKQPSKEGSAETVWNELTAAWDASRKKRNELEAA